MEQIANEGFTGAFEPSTDTGPAFLGQVQGERFRRQAGKKPPQPLVTIFSDDDFAALQPGQKFIGPDKQERVKPYYIAGDEELASVPEGATFVGPDGEPRVKPKYENVNFTAQTLYSMSLNDKEKYNALARVYGKEKIKKDEASGEWYVEEGDTRLKASTKGGRSTARFMGGLASEVAPLGGAIAGGIAGGGAGLVASGGNPVVAAGTGMLSAASGGGAGTAFNGLIMTLAGVADRSSAEQNRDIAGGFMMGGLGEGAGRAIAGSFPAVKAGVQDLSGTAGRRIGKFLGADKDPAATQAAGEMAARGVLVPPSIPFKHSPYGQTAVEVMDPTFRTEGVLMQSAEKYYGGDASRILEKLGVEVPPQQITKPTAGVSSEAAGKAAMDRVTKDVQREDGILQQTLDLAKEAMAGSAEKKGAGFDSTMNQLRLAADRSRAAAQRGIDEGYAHIDREIGAAMRAGEMGANSGQGWQRVGDALRAENTAIKQRASKMYSDTHEVGGAHLPNSEGLPGIAREFLETLPDTFKSKHPDIVKKIEAWAEKVNPETGEVVRPAETPTFAQLHNLRSQLRSDVDPYDLTPSIKDGTYKFFNNRVNEILHDTAAVPELKTAARMLDAADAFYSENMQVFRDNVVKSVMSGLKSGEPADPKVLAKLLLREGRSDLTRRVEQIIGPNLMNAVRASGLEDLMVSSRGILPGTIDTSRFVSEVNKLNRSDMLETVHGALGARLRQQAINLEQLEGRLAIPTEPGDTVATLIQRAQQTKLAVDEAAKSNPLGMLEKEIKTLEQEFEQAAGKIRAGRNQEELKFLYDPTYGAVRAADKILGSDDLIYAAASRFGPTSQEFNMLRQVWAQRLFQGTMEPGKKLFEMSPKMQAIMFPGVELQDALTLAKHMEYLMGSKMATAAGSGESIAAQGKVQNPKASLPMGPVYKTVKLLPFVGRAILENYFHMLQWGLTNPAFVGWIAKSMRSAKKEGGEAAKAKVREAVQLWMNRGGKVGAGAGEAAYQSSGGSSDE